MKSKRIIGLICLVAFVLLACNFPLLAKSIQTEAANTAEPTIQVQSSNPAITQTQPTANPPTSSPDHTGVACLLGTWTIDDFSPYVISALPQDMVQQYQITYNDMSGHVLLTFNNDKTMSMQAEDLQFNFSGKLSFMRVPLTVNVNGPATGDYTADETNLTTENVNTNKMEASARAMGQDLVDPPTIISAIPLLSPPSNVAKYNCSGDILQVRILSYPDNIPSLVFHRVN